MSRDFSKGKIYKITNDYNDDVYVGSSCNNLKKRFHFHKSASKIEGKNKSKLYNLINEIGFERFRIDLVENYPCNDKYELTQREAYWIKNIGTLNMKKNEGINKRSDLKAYNQMPDVKEKKNEYMRKKRLDPDFKNKEKTDRESNRDIILEKQKAYYKKKQAQIIRCECGCQTTQFYLNRHKKTQKHIQLMEALNNGENSVEILS